jgi:hypothetical protein
MGFGIKWHQAEGVKKKEVKKKDNTKLTDNS